MAEPNVLRSGVDRELMWTPWEEAVLEHLRLVANDEGAVANGLVMGLEAGRPSRIGYQARCDGHGRGREVRGGARGAGVVMGRCAGRPARIGYEVRCDGHWRVREVRAAAPDLERPVLELLADG